MGHTEDSTLPDELPGLANLVHQRRIDKFFHCTGGISDLKRAIEYLEGVSEKYRLIGCLSASPSQEVELMGIVKAEYRKWFFFKEELRFDPTENPMVPHHRLATEEERESLPEKKALPLLPSSDIIARWKGFDIGSIIAIERQDDETYFRIVR